MTDCLCSSNGYCSDFSTNFISTVLTSCLYGVISTGTLPPHLTVVCHTVLILVPSYASPPMMLILNWGLCKVDMFTLPKIRITLWQLQHTCGLLL